MAGTKKDLKYLLIGSKGQLGKEFEKSFILNKLNYKAVDVDDLDISNYSVLNDFFNSYVPDIVINCAAFNQVDLAEKEENKAYSVNANGPKYLATCCRKSHCFLIHFSSDYVFDGNKIGACYIEEDKTNPINVYGKSKLKGEEFIKNELSDFLIFRLSWVFGEGNQNFIYKFIQWTKKNKVLKISFDEVSVPTFTNTVVELTNKALESGVIGTYHAVNSGYTSRYEWAKFIAKELNLDVLLYPVNKSQFGLTAERPYFSAMDNRKLIQTLDTEIPGWEDSVKDFLKSY